MDRRYSITCERDLAKRIESLAREYDLTTQEVLEQLVTVGLEEIESERSSGRVMDSDRRAPDE